MWKNYLKIALRTLRRQKLYASINIVGLAIGVACCVLIGLYVLDELSYDDFHENAGRLYRIVHEDNQGLSARTPVPLGPTIEEDLSAVVSSVRFWRAFQPVIGYGDERYQEHGHFYFADPSALDVFSFNLVRGKSETALQEPGTVVLTESAANKYFGQENPIGKTLSYDGYPGGTRTLTVTGVIEDLPSNTHFDFRALASLQGIETEQSNWGSWKPIWTYVLLSEGTSPSALGQELASFLKRHTDSSTRRGLKLEPIPDIHLYSDYQGGFKPGSSITYVYLFSAIGLFILILACINFVNLATARSLRRVREVGMRKVLGAQPSQLVTQFIGEALVQVGAALLVGLLFAELLLPVLNTLSGKELSLSAHLNGVAVVVFLGGGLLIGLISGAYPAFYLAGYQPAIVLSGGSSYDASGAGLRKGLVVFQFTISSLLVIGTAITYEQLRYIHQKDLGVHEEQVVVVPNSEEDDLLIERLEQHTNILEASSSSRVPASVEAFDTRPVALEGAQESMQVHNYFVDADFLDVYGIELIAGRDLSPRRASDSTAFLINETAVRTFGWSSPEDALGQMLVWGDRQKIGPVVGVVEDFHLSSLHEAIAPLVLHKDLGWGNNYISVRIRTERVTAALGFIEQTWKEATPDGAYQYFFIDESFEQLHRADRRFGRIVSAFAGLAILISCLGLFGLAAYTTERRTKEIGIRKVLGASVASIVALLSKDFLKLVVAAFVIAAPVAYWAMQRWLESFAYRIDLGPGLFLGTGVLVLLIALLTVSYQAVKAALMDPVKSLRYE